MSLRPTAPRATPACATATPRLPARCHASIVSSRRRVILARVSVPSRTSPPPPSLLACAMCCDSATLRDSSDLPPCATFATLCDSAPTPSVLRSRRPIRTACHLSPHTRGEPSQSFPAPCSAEATSQTLNYQGRRLAFATTRLPRSHRKLSQLPLPAPAPARLSLRLIVPFTHPYTTSAKVTRHSTVDASTMACDVRRRRRRPRPEARAT